jgi:alanine racemase
MDKQANGATDMDCVRERVLTNPSVELEGTESGAWVEIDREAISRNLQSVLSVLGSETTPCAVVKGNAYGHGIEHVLPILQAQGINIIGIADNLDARRVRSLGFTGRLLRVRTATAQEVIAAAGLGIEEMIGGLANARAMSKVAEQLGQRLRTHVVLNSTGLCRDGLDVSSSEGRLEAEELLRLPMLMPIGIASHFATQEVPDTVAMLEVFLREAAWLQTLVAERTLELHCGTTFAALSVPAARLDLVRIGGALFGETAALHPRVQRAMTLKSQVAAVNTYPAGAFVGYGRGHRLSVSSVLACIPIGYAGGYRRSFDGRGECLVRGRRARVLGKISMNTLVVDVTEIPDVSPGDEVVFFGRQGMEEITAADVELTSETPVLELCTLWGITNPRRGI